MSSSLETPYSIIDNQVKGQGRHATQQVEYPSVCFAVQCNRWFRRNSFPILPYKAGDDPLPKPPSLLIMDDHFGRFVLDLVAAKRDTRVTTLGRDQTIWPPWIFWLFLFDLLEVNDEFYLGIAVVLTFAVFWQRRYERKCFESVIQKKLDNKWKRAFQEQGYNVQLVVEKGYGIAESYIQFDKVSTDDTVIFEQVVMEEERFWIVPFLRKARVPTLRYWARSNACIEKPESLKNLDDEHFRAVYDDAAMFLREHFATAGLAESVLVLAACLLVFIRFFVPFSRYPLVVVIALFIVYRTMRPVILEFWLRRRIPSKIITWQEKLQPTGFTVFFGTDSTQCCYPTGYLQFVRISTPLS